jgi:hypothetical protein
LIERKASANFSADAGRSLGFFAKHRASKALKAKQSPSFSSGGNITGWLEVTLASVLRTSAPS